MIRNCWSLPMGKISKMKFWMTHVPNIEHWIVLILSERWPYTHIFSTNLKRKFAQTKTHVWTSLTWNRTTFKQHFSTCSIWYIDQCQNMNIKKNKNYATSSLVAKLHITSKLKNWKMIYKYENSKIQNWKSTTNNTFLVKIKIVTTRFVFLENLLWDHDLQQNIITQTWTTWTNLHHWSEIWTILQIYITDQIQIWNPKLLHAKFTQFTKWFWQFESQ